MSPAKKATFIATATGLFLAIIKFTIGLLSNSIAILSSAIDSLLDMFVSIFNNIAVSKAEEGADEEFNYGKGKIEALAAFLEGLVISASGIYVIIKSIEKILTRPEVTHINWSIIVMLISIVTTGVLVLYLGKVAKATSNLVIRSDALHYKTDLLSNAGILVSIVIIYFTDWWIIDGIIGLFIGMYIIYEAYKIVKEGYKLLLDIALEPEEVEKIKEIIGSNTQIESYHQLKTRFSGNKKYVQAHLVFGQNMSLIEAHNISHDIEDKIRELDDENRWNIMFHLDPYDDSSADNNY